MKKKNKFKTKCCKADYFYEFQIDAVFTDGEMVRRCSKCGKPCKIAEERLAQGVL